MVERAHLFPLPYWPGKTHITPIPIGENIPHGHKCAKEAGKCSFYLDSPFPSTTLHSERGGSMNAWGQPTFSALE